MAIVHSLHCYPVKSARGLNPSRVTLTDMGFANDRNWMLIDRRGRFLSQRVAPRLARLQPTLNDEHLILDAAGMPTMRLPLQLSGATADVVIWKDKCRAFDAGDAVAQWVSTLLDRPCRLVQFDPAQVRLSDAKYSGPIRALNRFTDAFPVLVIGTGSLEDLNSRLPSPLPMTRFRPNLVLGGLAPYEEDGISELTIGTVKLRLVKACTRCISTTTDQLTGERLGLEPLETLRRYRYDPELRGVKFGQNAVILGGVGATLELGQEVGIN